MGVSCWCAIFTASMNFPKFVYWSIFMKLCIHIETCLKVPRILFSLFFCRHNPTISSFFKSERSWKRPHFDVVFGSVYIITKWKYCSDNNFLYLWSNLSETKEILWEEISDRSLYVRNVSLILIYKHIQKNSLNKVGNTKNA